MPSSYYKIRNVEGVSGGHFTDPEDSQPRTGRSRELSFTDTITQRVVGSKFQEVNRDSTAYGRLPIGSPVHVNETGQFVPPPSSTAQTPVQGFGPNYDPSSSETYESGHYDSFFRRSEGQSRVTSELGDDWVDVLHDPPQKFGDELDHENTAGGDPDMRSFPPIRPRRRPQRTVAPPSDHRETFPLRANGRRQSHEDPLPPHLRLQQRQPFVRPMSGLDHNDLGMVYTDISNWRTRLKAINAEIADAQRNSYNDIADGARIKGWIMVGKGLRFLPGIELIDGRSKEDIRWDELQHQGSAGNQTVYWMLAAFLFVLLAAGLSAVAGLLLATSPGMAQYLPFFRNLQTWNKIPSGIVTVLIPTIAATIFITAVVVVIRRKSWRLSPLMERSSGYLLKFLSFRR
jgi:calcium permeable stress-gated cation channel